MNVKEQPVESVLSFHLPSPDNHRQVARLGHSALRAELASHPCDDCHLDWTYIHLRNMNQKALFGDGPGIRDLRNSNTY